MGLVILSIVVAWLLLSLGTSLLVGALAQGGRREDRSRGHLVDTAEPGRRTPSRRRIRFRVAEFRR